LLWRNLCDNTIVFLTLFTAFYAAFPRMNLLAKTVATATLVSLPCWAMSANAATFSNLYSFGDSLSDSGNSVAASGFPPEPFYDLGRFSNGSVWVEDLAQDLGLSLTPSTSLPANSPPTTSINYAYGGATSGTKNLGEDLFSGVELPGLQQQVGSFVSSLNGQRADSNALYTIWAGSNDYFDTFSTTPTLSQVVRQPFITVGNLSRSIRTLSNQGARNILISNLPNLGSTPVGSGSSPFALNVLTATHNTLLSWEVSRLQRSLPNTNIQLFDVNKIFREAIAGQYGFGNVTDSCTGIDFPSISQSDLPGLEACNTALANDPKAFLFYDNQHPTSAAHEILADAALAQLQPTLSSASDSLSLASISAKSEFSSVAAPEPGTWGAVGLATLGLLSKSIWKKRNN
jgi:phospholipase/lecithinase/hemolysin